MEWLDKNLGGLIIPLGEKTDSLLAHLFTILGPEGGLLKIAKGYLYIATPVLGLLFFLGIVGEVQAFFGA